MGNTKEEVNNVKEEEVKPTEANVEEQEEQAEEPKPVLSELEQAQADLAASQDKYTRLYADFENFRRRTAKEKLELMQSGGSDIIASLLSVVDDFDRAIQNNEKVDDIAIVKEGFSLIQHKLASTLEQKGLKAMEDVIGNPLNVDLHEAITKIPAPDKKLKGKVVDVAEKGYFYNDKVLRFAKVIVGE